MADSEDPKSCEHGNVTTAAGEFEHYDRLGPGCWHPVKGGQCRSWQALVEHAQSVAAARAEARVRAEVAEEIARAMERQYAVPDPRAVENADWIALAVEDCAKIARAIAAGSSPDTTPERPRCESIYEGWRCELRAPHERHWAGDGGGRNGATWTIGNEPRTTPEPQP